LKGQQKPKKQLLDLTLAPLWEGTTILPREGHFLGLFERRLEGFLARFSRLVFYSEGHEGLSHARSDYWADSRPAGDALTALPFV